MNELIKDELIKDEEILWYGQPNSKVLFSVADIFLIPFSLLWGGFAMFWEITAITHRAPLLFCLFGIPFVFVGIYIIFGRFIYKSVRKKNTYYAVTNQRILIINKLINKSLQAEFIQHIPCIDKSVRSSGIGTIKFGNSPLFIGMYGNSGMEFFGSRYRKDVPAFYDIEDTEKVYRLVNELRKGEMKQ